MAGRSGIGVLVTGLSRVGALKKHAPLVFSSEWMPLTVKKKLTAQGSSMEGKQQMVLEKFKLLLVDYHAEATFKLAIKLHICYTKKDML